MLERIVSSEGTLLALIARSGNQEPGVHFISRPDFPLQLGVSTYPAGGIIRSHRHPPRILQIQTVQEVIHIDSGRVCADVYDGDGNLVRSAELSGGDTIFFIDGGHGLRILERTKIIEVKQGTYPGPSADKVYLGGPAHEPEG